MTRSFDNSYDENKTFLSLGNTANLEDAGLQPLGKFAAQIVERLVARFFQPGNDNPPPGSEDAA